MEEKLSGEIDGQRLDSTDHTGLTTHHPGSPVFADKRRDGIARSVAHRDGHTIIDGRPVTFFYFFFFVRSVTGPIQTFQQSIEGAVIDQSSAVVSCEVFNHLARRHPHHVVNRFPSGSALTVPGWSVGSGDDGEGGVENRGFVSNEDVPGPNNE
jgi:hypothetical protein